ncbi:hypothetical protein [Bradyrhizobium sp. th.b2]|uniref:hypothetical protein n=1 Tax=Bradyrhizobium sp. th-b2 TaxID=172088 RepID=UPI00048C7D97|nr:hypothetical protein [Bradyrhizobium sp. th.b2]
MKNTPFYLGADGRPLSADEQELVRKIEREDNARIAAKQRELTNNLACIDRFKEQQLVRRNWIAFDDVIDWRSRDRETGVEREDYLVGALRDLDRAIYTGTHFFEGAQSRILLTFPFVDVPAALLEDPLGLPSSYWLSRAHWQALHELAPARNDESDAAKLKRLFRIHLLWAWIPLELCLRWSENVPFEPRPEWFSKPSFEQAPPASDDAVPTDGSQAVDFESSDLERPTSRSEKIRESLQGEQQLHQGDGNTRAARTKSRGRKPGQGSYASLDAPLLLAMSHIISQGKAASPEEAARQVASHAHGHGTVDSRAERLARRFRKENAKSSAE